jgi:hypothetical protein
MELMSDEELELAAGGGIGAWLRDIGRAIGEFIVHYGDGMYACGSACIS